MSDRPLVHQVPLFAVVGAAATLTHVAAATTAREFGHLPPLQATLVGYLTAVGVSYLGNARLTFRRRALHGPQFLRFVVVSLLGLGVSLSLTWLLVQRIGWAFVAAQCVVAVAVPALSFVLSRAWAFRQPT